MRLAVIGGKGGVGKSTVAYNLGAELDAVVVDADLGMADLPASHGPDLHDVLAGRADPVEAVRDGRPVALLPCGRSLAGARAADPTELVAVIRRVADEYGRVVVDSPAGLSSDVGLPLLAAEACVSVTTPDLVALTDGLRARELARTLDAGLARVVLNRVTTGSVEGNRGNIDGHDETDAPDDHVERNGHVQHVERAFGAPVVPVPESAAVARAADGGLPVRNVDPQCRATAVFSELAAGVQRAVNSTSSW